MTSVTLGRPLVLADESGFHAPSPADFWQPYFGPEGWEITRPMFVMTLVTIGLVALLTLGTKNLRLVPGKGQFLFETVYGFVRNDISRDLIGSKHYKRYVPFLLAIFFFVLANNLMGITPLVMLAPTAVIGVPIALTAVVYVVYHLAGFRQQGFIGYFKHMVPEGVPLVIRPVVLLLEIFSYFVTRPLTLALRLFGNMFAGHMILTLFVAGGWFLVQQGALMAIAGAGSFLMAFLMTFFELLIQVVQAYVFTLLAASYIGDGLAEGH
ncbi:ATP synthase F0 sector subunit a [Serinicoccus hydrothermalis]|uniref:ATP synthase subunit a n=1 Tax=Serinicoccus hydrothermalis TaxID=1758689 RepID=A0A1B1NB40_9MICO|nr:F0F1 ATP synthase subunit A [Serinicoccus hydrothermalis]ANS78650.1 ATP synthase F0 sector subunit a [Serinicoccus hydrothermalis]